MSYHTSPTRTKQRRECQTQTQSQSQRSKRKLTLLPSALALCGFRLESAEAYFSGLPTALVNLPGVGQTDGVVIMAEKESSAATEDGSRRDMASSSTSAALELWMLKWLQLHRQSLLDGLQNAVQIILDYLVEKGHMHLLRTNVYQEISLETTTSLDKARKLLDWLATQPSSTFWAFQDALRQERLKTEAIHRLAVSDKEMRELMELVVHMSPSERLDLVSCHSPSVLKAREKLQKTYRSKNELLMRAGLSKGKTMTMDQIMVNVCLLSSEEVEKAFDRSTFSSHQDQERSQYLFSRILDGQSSFLSLEDVFKAKRRGENAPHKAVATGGAGCGKSVCFTRKAPYEWAFGRLWEQFALLFCLELRDKSVWMAKTLAELLKLAELNLSAKEQEEVVEFITSHPDQVVIICDGLDEGSVDDSSLLWRVLQGTSAGAPSNLHIVVTTRPCTAAVEVSQNPSYRGLEVVGFTEKDVKLFVCKYLGEETGKKLLSLLDKQSSIAGMMHVPLFCLLVCQLFEGGHALPARRTDLFKKIVVAVLHCFAKAKGVKTPFQDWTDAPAKVREPVIGLGKVAFEGLQKKQLYFTDVELVKAGMPLEALELGLLSKSESTDFEFWKRDEYTFSHLTVQEFLAAVYVSSEVLQTDASVGKLLEKVRFGDGHLTTFWVFVAGLLDDDLVEVFLDEAVSAIPTQPRWIRLTHSLQAFRCYVESRLGEKGAPSAGIGRLLTSDQLNMEFTLLSVSDCTAIGTVLEFHSQAEYLNMVSFEGCRLTDSGLARLLPGLQRCKSIKSLRMARNSLSFRHMRAMSTLLTNNAGTLEEVDLESNEIGDDGVGLISGGLWSCTKLKELWLAGNGLTSRSGANLSNVLSTPGLSSLEQLSISGLGDDGMERLADVLQSCTRLQKLIFWSMPFTSRSVPVLHRLLSALPSLALFARKADGVFNEDVWKELKRNVAAKRIRML